VNEAAYLKLYRSGELANRVREARRHLESCDLCANLCDVDRLVTKGRCRTGLRAVVSSAGPPHGEERPLSGRRGSGTIFFSWCNLNCKFCQNAHISQRGEGLEISDQNLAQLMLDLQDVGCHNINLVSPSHVIAQILAALEIAAGKGLQLPLVFNSGGYDSPAGLDLLDGVIDIYMPDIKFADSQVAGRYLGVEDYAEVNRAAVREMHRQVGDLQLSEAGFARRGLLVRHLVMPNDLAGTNRTLDFLALEISAGTYLNLMGQYRPCYQAFQFPDLDRRPSGKELRRARRLARQHGLHRLD
jgi:putative pyruvate formate lyase activating enzyme